jgi:hypothetical protein
VGSSNLPPIVEMPDEEENDNMANGGSRDRRRSTIKDPAEIFSLFIAHLGPCMRSLAFTLKEILDELPYGPAPQYEVKNNPKVPYKPSASSRALYIGT